MAVQKYFWDTLKVDFMNSPYAKVQTWRNHTTLTVPSPNNPILKKNTKGWTKEKAEREKEKAQKIIEKVQEKEITDVVEALQKMKSVLARRVNVADELNASDLNKIWGMLRVENGLPITIAKNENKNEDITREKELEVLKGLAEKVLANVSNNTSSNTSERNT